MCFPGKWQDNGVAHQFMSQPLDQGETGKGWTMLEIVLVRLNETHAPEGRFHTFVPGLGSAYDRTRIGLDAALCVQEIKPYMLDSYNNVGVYHLSVVIGSLTFARRRACLSHSSTCTMGTVSIPRVKRWKVKL
jgi:hypothetical protein